ncbi:MAG: TIGR04283 family arsenosugar biosynthesis glycosyltransferase [Sediminibacterium sp.]
MSFYWANFKRLFFNAMGWYMISIIIPVYNEEQCIGNLIAHLQKSDRDHQTEIIVVDGGSTDLTCTITEKMGVKVYQSPAKGRAAQMNFGASKALHDILYFVHADILPPVSFVVDILKEVHAGKFIGRYRTRFHSNLLLLRVNAFFTRFDLFMCYGGDQTLFITKTLFEKLNGFRESMQIMEEYEFVARARLHGTYTIMPNEVLVSARKYKANSWLQVQRANYRVVKMYKKGASQEEIVRLYKELLKL